MKKFCSFFESFILILRMFVKLKPKSLICLAVLNPKISKSTYTKIFVQKLNKIWSNFHYFSSFFNPKTSFHLHSKIPTLYEAKQASSLNITFTDVYLILMIRNIYLLILLWMFDLFEHKFCVLQPVTVLFSLKIFQVWRKCS